MTAASSRSGGDKGAPRHAVLLRWGGMLSVLDLSRGAELMLADEVRARVSVADAHVLCVVRGVELLAVRAELTAPAFCTSAQARLQSGSWTAGAHRAA